jgi:hypothetical protein
VICFCKHFILEEWVSVEVKLKLETLWLTNPVPFDVLQVLESFLVPLLDLDTCKALIRCHGIILQMDLKTSSNRNDQQFGEGTSIAKTCKDSPPQLGFHGSSLH